MAVRHERGIESVEPLPAIGIQSDLVDGYEDVLVLQAVHLGGEQHSELRTGAGADRSHRLDQCLTIGTSVHRLYRYACLLLKGSAVSVDDRLQRAAYGDGIVEGQFRRSLRPQDRGCG